MACFKHFTASLYLSDGVSDDGDDHAQGHVVVKVTVIVMRMAIVIVMVIVYCVDHCHVIIMRWGSKTGVWVMAKMHRVHTVQQPCATVLSCGG